MLTSISTNTIKVGHAQGGRAQMMYVIKAKRPLCSNIFLLNQGGLVGEDLEPTPQGEGG